VRYGYRKIRVLLNREGWPVGEYLVYGLYQEEGLALKKPPNQAWSLDFVADELQDGRRFRCLTMVDVYTRERLAIEAGQSLNATDSEL
jgi:putative transposase